MSISTVLPKGVIFVNYIITNGELCHYGVKGMKWGVRRQKKYNDRVSRVKRLHSQSRYESEAASYESQLKRMNASGYKKYAKDNYLDEYSDRDQRKMFAEQQTELRNRIASAKHFANNASLLSKRLDSIDTSSMSYKKAVKLVRQYENDWVNETIGTDPTLKDR